MPKHITKEKWLLRIKWLSSSNHPCFPIPQAKTFLLVTHQKECHAFHILQDQQLQLQTTCSRYACHRRTCPIYRGGHWRCAQYTWRRSHAYKELQWTNQWERRNHELNKQVFFSPLSLGHTRMRMRVCIPVLRKFKGIPSPIALKFSSISFPLLELP